jgi:hypothetical protein
MNNFHKKNFLKKENKMKAKLKNYYIYRACIEDNCQSSASNDPSHNHSTCELNLFVVIEKINDDPYDVNENYY